jgi:hypothetical protein
MVKLQHLTSGGIICTGKIFGVTIMNKHYIDIEVKSRRNRGNAQCNSFRLFCLHLLSTTFIKTGYYYYLFFLIVPSPSHVYL